MGTVPFVITILLVVAACGPRFDPSAIPAFLQPTGNPTVAPTSTGAGPATVAPTTQTNTRTIAGQKGSTVTGGVIKVGGLFPESGGLSTLGKAALDGARAAFAEANSKGGIRGKQIKFVTCDDQADDTQSLACSRKLVEQEGVFIMGPSFTPFSLSPVNYLKNAGVPWVGYDGINIEGFEAPNVVTVGSPIEEMAHALLPYWYRKIQSTTGTAPSKIGAVVLDVAPAQTYLSEAKNVICPKLGCQIIAEQFVTYQTTQYTTICSNMIAKGAQAIWIITDPASAIKLLTGCRSQRPQPGGFLGQHGIYLDLTLDQSGPAAEGMFANGAVLPDTEDTPATEEMRRVIRRFNSNATFGYFASLGYSSALMVMDLVDRILADGKALTRANVLAAARSIGSYNCRGLCKSVNLSPPAKQTGGNHNVWIVRADFSTGKGRWVKEAGPIDVFTVDTWPCPGKPC